MPSACRKTVCFPWCSLLIPSNACVFPLAFRLMPWSQPPLLLDRIFPARRRQCEWSRSVSSVSCHAQFTDGTDAAMPVHNHRSRDPEWTLSQLSLPEHRRHRRYNVGSRGRCAHGWAGGDGKREHWRRSEMLRTPESVRQRALSTCSVGARVSSVGSRYMMTGMPQSFGGLRPCKTFRITDGPGQRSLRWQPLFCQSPLLRRRDLAAHAYWIGCLLRERD